MINLIRTFQWLIWFAHVNDLFHFQDAEKEEYRDKGKNNEEKK